MSSFVDVIDEQLLAASALRKKGVRAGAVYAQLTRDNYEAPKARKPSPSAPSAPSAPSDDTTTVWKVPVGSSPTLGPANAPVTLVVFSDFQCPFCARLHPVLEQLRNKYGKQLRLVFKNNPLSFHKRAEPAAQLALEAEAQRGDAAFWRAADALFASQKHLEDADLEQIASKLGLDVGRAMRAVHGSKHQKKIDADQGLAGDLDAGGTPTSFVNGRRLVGARPSSDFEALVDEEIAHAKTLRAKGVPASRLYDHLMKSAKLPPPAPTKQVPAPTASDPTRGPRGAKVTIQMFTDFECPFCGRVQDTLTEIQKKYPHQVRFVFHHRPLDFHAQAMEAHEAAAEAFRQGGNRAFWKMHDLLFANQDALDRASLLRYGKQVGLNVARLERALDSRRHQAAVEQAQKVAEKAGINGTPAFVINGYYLSGAQSLEKFERVIRHALNNP